MFGHIRNLNADSSKFNSVGRNQYNMNQNPQERRTGHGPQDWRDQHLPPGAPAHLPAPVLPGGVRHPRQRHTYAAPPSADPPRYADGDAPTPPVAGSMIHSVDRMSARGSTFNKTGTDQFNFDHYSEREAVYVDAQVRRNDQTHSGRRTTEPGHMPVIGTVDELDARGSSFNQTGGYQVNVGPPS